MDLDDLRHALGDAALRHTPADVSGARSVVRALAQRHRRRRRGVASAALVAGAIAMIVLVLVIAGGGATPGPSLRTGPAATSPSTVPVTTAPPMRTCTSSQLRLTFDKDLGSLMQQPGAYFALTNASSATCTLDGYPQVQLFDTAGHRVTTRQYDGGSYQINDPGAHVVSVAPSATVYFGLGWTDVNQATGGTEQGCVDIGSASVVIPGSRRALSTPARLGEVFCPPGAFVSPIAPKGAFTPSAP